MVSFFGLGSVVVFEDVGLDSVVDGEVSGFGVKVVGAFVGLGSVVDFGAGFVVLGVVVGPDVSGLDVVGFCGIVGFDDVESD